MALSKHHQINLETIIRAAENDDLCVMEAREISTGKIVALLAASNYRSGKYELVPLAVMIDTDPYEAFIPPNFDGPDSGMR